MGSVQHPSETTLLLRDLILAMVDVPEEVEVYEVEGQQATMLEVRVARSDHGKLLGRQGRNASAIRELLVNLGGKDGRRYILSILEDHPQAYSRSTERPSNR